MSMLIKDILYHGIVIGKNLFGLEGIDKYYEFASNTIKDCHVFDMSFLTNSYLDKNMDSGFLRNNRDCCRLPFNKIWLELGYVYSNNEPQCKIGALVCDNGGGVISGYNIGRTSKNVLMGIWKYDVNKDIDNSSKPVSATYFKEKTGLSGVNNYLACMATELIKILNTKNCSYETSRINIKRQKFNGNLKNKKIPYFVSHTIYVNYKGKKMSLRDIFNEKDDKGQKRLHDVRGHFSTYTEDAPLFGKLTGTFWIPPHWRGSEDVGRVDKTYKIIGKEDVVSVAN